MDLRRSSHEKLAIYRIQNDDEGPKLCSQVEMVIKGLETDNQKMNGDSYPRLMMKIKCYGEVGKRYRIVIHFTHSPMRLPSLTNLRERLKAKLEESDKELG